jgi:hypothetical protein
MKFRGASRVQALLAKHCHMLPLNKLLTTVVTNMEFGTLADLNWRGIDHAALNLITEHLALSGALQQRWFKLVS